MEINPPEFHCDELCEFNNGNQIATHISKIFLGELEIEWKNSVVFLKIWTSLFYVIAKSSSNRNVARLPYVPFQIHVWAKDHCHQGAKSSNTWQ